MSQCSVLLVDDEAEFISTLAQRLRKRSLDVSTATSGLMALERTKEAVPDVMVVDLNMAVMDGIEVLKRVKQEHPHMQVLILTGQGCSEKAKAALNLGAFACLEKPVPIQEVVSAINAAYEQLTCDERHGEQQDVGGKAAPAPNLPAHD